MIVAGCAQQPRDISGQLRLADVVRDLTCDQLLMEGQRVSARAAEVTGTQQQKAESDAVAMGVGLVLFWPALFFIKGDKQTAGEVARLKGEMEAIQQASVARNCGITLQPTG